VSICVKGTHRRFVTEIKYASSEKASSENMRTVKET